MSNQGKGMKYAVVIWLLGSLWLASCISEHENEKQGASADVQVGDPLPVFEVTMADGQQVNTDSLLGKRAVVVFFHTTCPDCQKELPRLDSLYRAHHQESDFRLICVARAQKKEEIQPFWEREHLSLPYSPQPDRSIYNLFAGSIIPRIYIASPDGIVRFTHDDKDMPSFRQLEEEVRNCLSE
jgi:peroxiredoxin